MAGRNTRACSVRLCLFLFLAFSCPGFATDSKSQLSAQASQVHETYQTGMRLVQQRHLDEAIETFNQGLHSDPNNVVLLNAVGAAYTLKQYTGEAQRYFLKALSIDPQFAPARKNLALTYFDSGKYDLAAPQFEELTHDTANSQMASMFLGMIAKRKGDYGRAVELFRSSGSLAFAYPDSILSFAESLYRSKQEQESRSVLSKLDNAPDLSARQWFQAGRLNCSLNRYEQAQKDFDKARELDPALPNIDYLRAYVLSKMGRSNDALEILHHLTAQEPGPDPLNLLGHVAEDVGNVQLSLDAFKKALELAPNSEENYLDYSSLCMSYDNSALALDAVRIGLEHIPHSYRLTVQEGAILASQGKQEEAKNVFQTAMRLQSDNKEAFLGLAVALTNADRFGEAIQTFKDGVERFPNDLNLNYYYAFALFRMAQHQGLKPEAAEEVRRALDRCIQLNPRFASAYYLRAKYYTVMEPNRRLATENLETCLHLQPRYVPAKYQLALLYIKANKKQEGENLLREVREEQAEELKKEQDHPRIVISRGSPFQTMSRKELP